MAAELEPAAVPQPLPPAPQEAAAQRTNVGEMIPSRLRADLVVQKQTFRHEDFFVLKDPLALTYFRLRPEEAFILSQLDGKKNIREISAQFAASFPNKPLRVDEVAAFLHHLGNMGLLNVSAKRFIFFARQSKNQAASPHIIQVWAKLISQLMFFKVPLVDPSPWLGKLTHSIRFFWNRWVVMGCLAFFVWTAVWLFLHADAFERNTINFLAPSNLLLLWFTIITIKTIHEFGHATTCRYFGGEVHEMGAAMICFSPVGYVDASDSWMMPQRKHKIFVALAGIYVEFIIASIAAHVWLYSPPGLLQSIAFNAMLTASLNTVFFNMNPLMKFDGYYVVSDLLEVPNLRTKALAFVSLKLQRFFFGVSNPALEKAVENDHHGKAFTLYALFAFGYMTFLIYSLSQIFAKVLRPYGLGEFGLAVGVFVQASFVMLPLYKFFSDSFSGRSHVAKLPEIRRKLPLRYAIIAAVVLGFAFFPVHHSIDRQGVVLFEEGEQIGSHVGGIIRNVLVETGQQVTTGQVLVELSNPEVEHRLKAAELDLAAARLRLGQLLSNRSQASTRQLAEADHALEAATTALQRARDDIGQLTLRSPIAGTVVSPLLVRATGVYLPANHSLLRIVDTNKLRVILPLTETEVELVDVGSPVSGRWVADGRKLETTIQTVPTRRANREDYLPGMYALFGGPAPQETGHRTAEGGFPLFFAEASIDRPADLVVVEGMRIRTTITGKPTTLPRKWWRAISYFWSQKMLSFR
ncbi:MAG TPA: efflux RND transporter periplasmic adaptor subunit [Verrucomicrobiota bacterium]|nr:efflux RND transporter periplasmic adaptor subunit [Verrucomicrobiota bacterium]